MGTTDCLKESVRRTYDALAARLDAACEVAGDADHSRRGCPPIDMFSACVSKHMHAVDEVLLPCLPVNRDTHDFRAAQHEVEIVLSHIKAHEYGSSYQTGFSWSKVWGDARAAMDSLQREEEALIGRLGEMLDDGELHTMTDDLERREPREPTRPHPYLPHIGTPGQVMRRVMRMVDGFWDEADGRYVPMAPHAPRKEPGLIKQYLMGNPHFDDEE